MDYNQIQICRLLNKTSPQTNTWCVSWCDVALYIDGLMNQRLPGRQLIHWSLWLMPQHWSTIVDTLLSQPLRWPRSKPSYPPGKLYYFSRVMSCSIG